MKQRTVLVVFSFAAILLSVLCLLPETRTSVSQASPSSPLSANSKLSFTDKSQVESLAARLPLSFEPNTGQFDPQARFLSRGTRFNLFLTATGAVLEHAASVSQPGRAVLDFKIAGANPNAAVAGRDQLPGIRNYLIGSDPSRWRTNVPTYRAVAYKEIYPGIDLTYYGNNQQLEYDFSISPGRTPRAIRLSFKSKTQPRISESGELIVPASGGELRQHAPIAYQEINGERVTVDCRFVLLDRNQVGFATGSYDHTQTLVIDPTLVYSTYLGGAGDDSGSSIAIDGGGNAYIAGTTSSVAFPTHNPAFGAKSALADMFVTKIDATAGSIVYSTFVGGSGADRADGIAIDSNGNAYVVGRVDSTSVNFPTTAGSFAPAYRGGDFDGVAFKLNAQGNALVYSGFLGGEENDSAEGVTVDASGAAYVTGGTRSSAFPTTVNAYQSTRAGDTDAFLAKINASGSALSYSTFLGGSGTDRGSGVVADNSGIAYVAGYGASPDFPTEDPFQAGFGGSFDAFVAKFDTNASGINSLLFCSNLGGTSDDKAFGLTKDASGDLYIIGQTSSSNFPVLNPVQPSSGGSFDGFVAKVSSTGSKIFATYFGGSGDDRGTGIAWNSGGIYITGFTSSTNLPVVTPLQLNNGGGFDAFVAKLAPAGSSVIYATYIGGSANESFTASVTSTNPIAVDAANAYIAGYTSSANFPTLTPLQGSNAGAQDVFIAKISDATSSADYSLSVSPSSRNVSPGGNTTYTVTATPIGGFTGTIALSVSGASNDTTTGFSPTSIVITDSSPQSSTLSVTTTGATPPGSYSLNINSTSGNLQHGGSAQLIVSGATSANLSISTSASPNPGTAGSNLTYRVIVSNGGPSPATNIVLTDVLPGGVAFVSAGPGQGMCGGTTTVTCNLGSIALFSSVIVNITVTPQAAGQLTNTANVTATENDPDPTNNSQTIQTTITSAASGPSLFDPNLSVKTVVSGLSQPTSMAFIGNNDFLVLEKNTGKVQRIVNGALQSTVLDLRVNSASERGMLGIALHPNFAATHFVYLYWTESSTAADSTSLADVFQPLSNRVDRYFWNGATLTFDRNLIKLRAYQADPNQPLRGNHNGGVLRFGPDGKLYILMGDNGRRGFLQNLPCGPTQTCPGPVVQDDQFGGPEPDDNHLTGVILRLNDDGTAPTDNPFFNVSTTLTGQAAANIKKIYAYGVRNGFGLGFDPLSGNLWDQENGDDTFDEMNRVTAGSNNGWVQMMGPSTRVSEFKQIESTYGNGDLQQLRWPPTFTADTASAAIARFYMLPGAHYNEPEFSWKYAIPAAPLGFVQGRGLGPQFEGDMFVGAARTFLYGGFLFRFKLSPDRLHFNFNDDTRLIDRVADNLDKFDITESEPFLIGQNFGITTDIETGPNGDLYVVSNTNSAVYEISGKQPTVFTATLTGAQETPPNSSTATGTATLLLSPDELTARVSLNFNGLSAPESAAHIHGPGGPGVLAPVLFPLPNGNLSDFVIAMSQTNVQDLKNGVLYINVHSNNFPNGEIRGQFQTGASASSFQFSSTTLNAAETAGTVQVTVTRLGNTSNAAAVDYAISNGTASSPSDFIAGGGTLNFAAGETFKTFSVSIVDDLFVEGNETINLSLSNPTNGTFLGSPNTATLTIFNNDNVSPLPPQLILEESGPAANQTVALEALALFRDPFKVQSIETWLNLGPDPNTRVEIFSPDLRLNAGELPSAVVVHLVDANNQTFDLSAEDVRPMRNTDIAQITFRLPNTIAAGACTVTMIVHGQTSNAGTFRISP